MLPSPGFSIPSIGTPLHQPEEDQQILPHAQQQQQQPAPTPTTLQQMPVLSTPQKTMHAYPPSGFTPQSLMQPQTPVSYPNTYVVFCVLGIPHLRYCQIFKSDNSEVAASRSDLYDSRQVPILRTLKCTICQRMAVPMEKGM